METTPILVYHKGQWQENKCYTNFETTGILIPKECTFTTLREILEEQVQINRQETLHIKYQLQEGLPPLKIETDFNIKFYMQIKSKEEDWMKYPLCIDIIVNEENLLLMKPKETSSQQIRNMCETPKETSPQQIRNTCVTSKETSPQQIGNLRETPKETSPQQIRNMCETPKETSPQQVRNTCVTSKETSPQQIGNLCETPKETSPQQIGNLRETSKETSPQQARNFCETSEGTSPQQIENMCETGSTTESYHQDGDMGETSIEASAVGNIDGTFVDFIDFANIVCKYVTEEATTPQPEEPRHDGEEIQVGDVFEDRDALAKHMSSYALKNRFHFRVNKSCKKQYNIRCTVETCEWNLKASANSRTNSFVVRKLNNNHTCPLDQRVNGSKNASTKLVADLIKSKYLTNIKTVYSPADIIRQMKDEHEVTLEYKKAWRSKQKALEMLRGKPDASYQKLPAYLHMLKKSNPGSVGEIQKTETNDFLFLFMALNASIKGWSFCKPIIIVDDTFLKASYGGTLLSAYTLDGNGRIFPLAFAIVDSENDNSWTLFFENLRKAFGFRDELCIVSDMDNNIVAAIKEVYPEASQVACTYHLLDNLKKHFKRNDKQLRESFVGAAKAYTNGQFQKHMSALDRLNVGIRPYLTSIGYDKWARIHCPNKKYFAQASNITESLNAAFVAGRELPVTTLLEYLRSLLQDWTCKNRDEARSTNTKMTRTAEEYLEKNRTRSLTLRVKRSNDHIFEVREDLKVYIVDLEKRSCTCNTFQTDEIPCPHAVAVLKETNQDPYDYCSYYYMKETMVATYSETVYPIGHEGTWVLPIKIRDMVVLPPAGMSKSGKKRKHKSAATCEKHLKITCGRCGESGHNKTTCKNVPRKTPVS